MLTLKPNCEWCDKSLPAKSKEAMICSYECTFCTSCVTEVFHNVCPNCGGGLCPRPIRPSKAYRQNVSLKHHAASTERVHSKYSQQELDEFTAEIKTIAPSDR